MTKIFDLCVLSILTTIFCIPIVTSSAALTSMYAVMMRLSKNTEGSVASSYVKEFRSNFKGSVAGACIFVAGLLLFSFDLIAWTQNEVGSRSIWYGATLVVLVLFLTIFDWYLCVRARFVETFTQALGNATRFTFIYLPLSVGMGAYTLVIGWLVSRFAFLLFFFPLVGFVVLCFPKAILIGRKIDRYIEDEGLAHQENTPEDEAVSVGNPETAGADDDSEDGEIDKAYRDLTEIKRETGEMTLKDKVSYVWFNHIAAIVFGVIFIAVVGGVTYNFIFNNKTCDFALAVVNAYSERTGTG